MTTDRESATGLRKMIDLGDRSKSMLHSPFARRFLLLFVLSAAVPASILGVFAYYQVSGEISALNRRDSEKQTKNAGLMLHEWLLHRRGVLDKAAGELGSGITEPTASTRSDGVRVRPLDADEFVHSTGDGVGGRYDFRRAVDPHLHEISRYVTTAAGDHVVLSISIPQLIKPYATVLSSADYCYLDHTGAAIQCSKPAPTDLLAQLNAFEASDDYRSFVYSSGGGAYLVTAWKLFMRAEFGVSDWTILMWRRESESLQAVARFKALYLPLVALTGSIGLLIGMVSIRRYLTPFRQLTEASNRLAKNDFDVRIDINSGDEVEQLGRAFNHMTSELKKKFKTLSTLSEIDRLILSSQTLEHIGEVLLSRIDALIACDVACIWFAESNSNELTTIIRDISTGEPVITTKSDIANDKIHAIARLSGNIDLHQQSRLATYLAPLISRGVTNGYAVAIPVDASHVANIFIGSKSGAALDQDDVQQLLEFSHRAAVALSNSVWRSKLHYQAHFDILTQLPNRRMFNDILEATLSRAQRENRSVGVLFIDLDEFKDVNDSLGHGAGDDLLAVVAERLRGAVRSRDTVARLGGDEFVVIVPDLNKSESHALIDLRRLGEKLLKSLETPITIAAQEIVVTASIGASFCPRDGKSAEDLLRNADAAMYAAKDRGRKGFCFYSDELSENARKKLQLRGEIANALEHGEFELYYQPKVDSRSGRIVGCESLIRWNHPERGLVGPGLFIEEIERSGAIIEVGYWTLMAAAKQLAAWHRRGFDTLSLSTNVSPRQFNDPNLLAAVQKALDCSEVQPKSFELEITESTACTDIEQALILMNQLRDLGLTMCIDDFGTGHSSLQYLQRMPVDVLKIDRSFVQQIGTSARGEIIIESVIALGRSMGLQIVAEGAETEAQIAFLSDHDCHVIQGYYYSKPVPAADFEKLLRVGTLGAAAAPAQPRPAITLVS